MAPSKKIIVCCDGTWNDSDGTDNVPTNVTKIARCLNHQGKSLQDPSKTIPQIVYYQSGVATKSAGTLGQNFDGLTGRGIKENVRVAYGFICNNYEPDDELYLVGFSRGAYTVRIISALINDVGLLTKHSLGYFYDIFNAWQAKNVVQKYKPGSPPPPSFKDIQDQLLSKKDFSSQNVRINACAVFDTVGSLGIPVSDKGPLGLPVDYLTDAFRAIGIHWLPATAKGTEAFTFVDTVVSRNIDHAIQALALDEHRAHFVPTIWEDPDKTTKSLKQCWFCGCHSHIGGGVEDNGDLPNISLAWMLDQLSPYLSFNPTRVNTTPSDDILKEVLKLNVKSEPIPKGEILTDSKKGLYFLDGSVIRTPSQYRTHRVDPSTKQTLDAPLKNTNEKIHKSVRVRFWNSTEMLADGKQYQPLALKNKWKPGSNEPWQWGLLKMDGKIPDLPEDDFTDNERAILKLWSNDGGKTSHLEDFELDGATH